MVSRRQCLHCFWSTLVAIHTPNMASTPRPAAGHGLRPDPNSPMQDQRPSLANPAGVNLQQVHLACSELKKTAAFYRDRLGLPVRQTAPNAFAVTAGYSELHFSHAGHGGQPFYHFALNISRNKFDQAKRWIAERTPIVVSPDGRDQFHFTSRDADAVYFLDPAGNLVEFIAHSRLSNQRKGEFSTADIHDVCEIGLVTPDVGTTLQRLKQDLNVVPYLPPASDEFAAVGDERGFLIVVKQGRLWFPRRVRQAAPFPTRVQLAGPADRTIRLKDSGFTIDVSRRTPENENAVGANSGAVQH